MNDTEIIVSPAFFMVVAVSALFDVSGTFSAVVIAVIIHELGHIAALKALKIRINTIRLRMFGLEISADIPKGKREAVIMIAGPGANILSAVLFYVISVICDNSFFISLTACSLILGFFHLLPCAGFDGGAALKALFYHSNRKNIVDLFVKVFTITVSICLIYAALRLVFTHKSNLSLLILPVYLILNLLSERNIYTSPAALT